MKKLLVLLLVLTTAVLAFTACGGGTTPPATTTTTITLDAAGGTVSATSVTVTKGESYTLPTPTKDGYTFDGWFLGTTKIESTGTWAYEDAAIALVAQWTEIPPVVTTITLNVAGGTVENATLTATVGETYTLPTPEKTGYTFDGWYNGETAVTATGTWAIEETAVTLTAKWTAKTTTVTFSDGVESATYAYDAAYTLPTPEKTGYTFAGWYNGETAVAATGTWATDAATLTLTAAWTAKTTTVTFSDDVESATYTYDAAYTLPTPEKTGYTFAGWLMNGEAVAATGTWTVDAETVALTAAWTAKTTTVTFSDGVESATYTYDAAYTLPTPEKTGHTFGGWYNGDDQVALSGTWATDAATLTLTAKWTVKATTVTFVNGTDSETKIYTYGEEYTIAALTKTGYNFEGWFNGETAFALTGTWTLEDETLTLTAAWTAKKTTVTYTNGDEATVVTYTYGEAYTLPTPDAKAGYTFDGWFVGDNQFVASETWALEDATLDLTAKWTKMTTKVTIVNGTETTTVTFTYGDAYDLGTPAAKEGYEFDGWKMNGAKVETTGTWTSEEAEVTIEAIWFELPENVPDEPTEPKEEENIDPDGWT